MLIVDYFLIKLSLFMNRYKITIIINDRFILNYLISIITIPYN